MQRKFGGRITKIGILMGLAAVMPASLAEAAAPAVIAPGIYSSVTLNPDSGDLGGLEVEIGKAGQVETVLCEGWCNSTDRTTYVRRGGSILFDLHLKSVEPGGRIIVDTRKVVLKPSGRNVLARVAGFETGWELLKRRPRAFGLSVAYENMQAIAKARR